MSKKNLSAYHSLEWSILTTELASYCQTEEGTQRAGDKNALLDCNAIKERWASVVPLLELRKQGYSPPIGELKSIYPISKAAKKGQVLDGEQLLVVGSLLESVHRISSFTSDLGNRCATLEKVRENIYEIKGLKREIEKAIDEAGIINDTASKELFDLRKQKRSLKRRIEQNLQQLQTQKPWETYLQDTYFTVRDERYVLPVRLDARARVPGTIVDTSEGGQTLLVEPKSLQHLNDLAQDLEVSEKIEMLRILRVLSNEVAANNIALEMNYETLIYLDELNAEATLALQLDASPITLCSTPEIALKDARHPFVKKEDGGKTVANDIQLQDPNRILVISGPNAGGKTVVLKTVGLLILMAKAGLLIPADSSSRLYLFDQIFIDMGDNQSLAASLSTFSGHLHNIKSILEHARETDLVLLDELAVGTEPRTGAAIARAVMEALAEQTRGFVTTHYEDLKCIALEDKRFCNGSMAYSLDQFKPMYKLNLNIPGQSFAIELATQIGLPGSLVERAKLLRGAEVSVLDKAVSELIKAKEKTATAEREALEEKERAQSAAAHWNQEAELAREQRARIADKLKNQFDEKLNEIKEKVDKSLNQLKETLIQNNKLSGNRGTANWAQHKHDLRVSLNKHKEELEGMVGSYAVESSSPSPGKKVDYASLREGDQVYVKALKNVGTVVKLGPSPEERIEVKVGSLKLKTDIDEIRLTSASKRQFKPNARKTRKKTTTENPNPAPFVLQSASTTVDLRGLDVDAALEQTWRSIDSAVLRGERALFLLHGHGNDRLKNAIRKALGENCPYRLRFTPGDPADGGDGVTLVYFDE